MDSWHTSVSENRGHARLQGMSKESVLPTWHAHVAETLARAVLETLADSAGGRHWPAETTVKVPGPGELEHVLLGVIWSDQQAEAFKVPGGWWCIVLEGDRSSRERLVQDSQRWSTDVHLARLTHRYTRIVDRIWPLIERHDASGDHWLAFESSE